MLSTDEIKKIARQVVATEAAAVSNLVDNIDDDFAAAVTLIINSKGPACYYRYRKKCNNRI
jgi:D-arabinose 5-phosphate isomerase GutQ